MRLRRLQEDEPGFQMAPMIDVVFELLIFFMVATGFIKTESELPSKLPASYQEEEAPIKTFEEVVIEVTRDNRIIINDEEYDSPESKELPQLRSLLERLVMLSDEQIVIIKADRNAKYQRVIDILNVCAGVKIKNVFFAGSGEEGIQMGIKGG